MRRSEPSSPAPILPRARLALLALGVICVPALTAAAAPHDRIKPGYWEATSKVTSPLPTKKVEKICITPDKVDKYMEGPSNHIYKCTYPTKVIGGGKILLKGDCRDKKGEGGQIEGSGTYSPTTLHVNASVKTKLAGLPITIRASSDLVRIGDICPADAKR
ncbi:MAG: DUF3617 family protein [Proteobacteria bacterium]|nr:DUF3617 family protein [Pseudomonadota bacterium]